MAVSRGACVSLIGLMLLGAGCASAPNGPREISLDEARSRLVQNGSPTTQLDRVLVSIAKLMERDLDLPELQAVLYFYPDRGAFRTGLEDAGYDPDFAREMAATMVAIGGFQQVLINETALRRLEDLHQVGLLAHELTHTVQYEWADGRRGTSDQWLREGFAEWVMIDVLEALRLSTRVDERERAVQRLRAANDLRKLPSLLRMDTFPNWVDFTVRPEGGAIYAQVLLAVHFLIERHGLPSVIAYFKLFADSQDRLGNFKTAFGEDLATFDDAFHARLAVLRFQPW